LVDCPSRTRVARDAFPQFVCKRAAPKTAAMTAAVAVSGAPASDAERSIVTQAIVLALCTMALFVAGAGAAAYFDPSAGQTVVITGNFAARSQADYASDTTKPVAVAPQRALPTPLRQAPSAAQPTPAGR
jgi:hypothetical protein